MLLLLLQQQLHRYLKLRAQNLRILDLARTIPGLFYFDRCQHRKRQLTTMLLSLMKQLFWENIVPEVAEKVPSLPPTEATTNRSFRLLSMLFFRRRIRHGWKLSKFWPIDYFAPDEKVFTREVKRWLQFPLSSSWTVLGGNKLHSVGEVYSLYLTESANTLYKKTCKTN